MVGQCGIACVQSNRWSKRWCKGRFIYNKPFDHLVRRHGTIRTFEVKRYLAMKLSVRAAVVCLFLLVSRSSSFNPLSHRRDFCDYKTNGLYPDPYDACKGFIHCYNYFTHYKLCGRGLLFSPKNKRCDWPRNVDCPMGILNCDVGIIGGGISGLYMAYMLLKEKKETSVCIFEKDSRLGGRILDYHFKEAPDVDVGLGAWRIDKHHPIMIALLKELGIKHREWSFEEPNLHESRGVIANNHESVKRGYPALKSHPVFGKMTSSQLLSHACKPEHIANADSFATVDTYFSNYITPEGAAYLSELYGYKGDYTDFISPKSYMEFTEMSLTLADKYIRPLGGMSTIIKVLKQKVEELGGKIYTSTGVKSIEKYKNRYNLITPKLRVISKKLVVGLAPLEIDRVNGSVAKRLQGTPELKSIQPVPAFKGAAVYNHAWWEKVNVAGTPIIPGQKFNSYSNCMGTTMAHRGKGTNSEGVMHTVYNDGECARRWRDIAGLKKNFLDTEVHRAMEYKFGSKIPKPIHTAYQFWDSAWHFQKPGTKFTMKDIADWAKRPFVGEDIFLVNEAYDPYRGWCEGSIRTCQNVLTEGWAIPFPSLSRSTMEGRAQEDIAQRLLFKSVRRA